MNFNDYKYEHIEVEKIKDEFSENILKILKTWKNNVNILTKL